MAGRRFGRQPDGQPGPAEPAALHRTVDAEARAGDPDPPDRPLQRPARGNVPRHPGRGPAAASRDRGDVPPTLRRGRDRGAADPAAEPAGMSVRLVYETHSITTDNEA